MKKLLKKKKFVLVLTGTDRKNQDKLADFVDKLPKRLRLDLEGRLQWA